MICLFFFSVVSNAQELPWLEVGSEWIYQHGHGFGPEHYQVKFGITEETIFEGKNGVKMEQLQFGSGNLSCAGFSPPLYLYISNDSLFYASEIDSIYRLAVHFGANVGDSWEFVTGGHVDVLETHIVTVNEVNTVDINGFNLRKLSLSYEFEATSGEEQFHHFFPQPINITDVIGSEYMFFIPFGYGGICDFETGTKLQCFSSESLSYQNPTFPSCDYILSSGAKTSEINLRVFPNPTSNEINLSFSQEINSTVYFYDLTGKLLSFYHINNRAITMDLEDFSSGMYLIKLPEYNQQIVFFKY